MKEIIKSILENYRDANLDSDSAIEEISNEIARDVTKYIIIRFFNVMNIRKITWEKDKKNQ